MFIVSYIVWHWPLFLFGAIIFFILLLAFILSLTNGVSKRKQPDAAKKSFLAAFVLLLVLLGIIAFTVYGFFEYMNGIADNMQALRSR